MPLNPPLLIRLRVDCRFSAFAIKRRGWVSYGSHRCTGLREAAVGAAAVTGGLLWPRPTQGQSQGLDLQSPPGARNSRGSRNWAWRQEASGSGGASRTREAAHPFPDINAGLRSAFAPAPGNRARASRLGDGGGCAGTELLKVQRCLLDKK